MDSSFEWDERKNRQNEEKHGVSLEKAQKAFLDPDKLIIKDIFHSLDEKRWFCVGSIDTGIITVRFTYRKGIIRILGAGYWRKLRKKYLKKKGII